MCKGFTNVVEVDPKKYSAAMSALEIYHTNDYEGFKAINQPFSINIDLNNPFKTKTKDAKEVKPSELFKINGNFHRIFEDNIVEHFYTYTEGYIPEEQIKLIQNVLALAYYQAYNILPKKVSTEFVNYNFYT
jgi:hypothetical protein